MKRKRLWFITAVFMLAAGIIAALVLRKLGAAFAPDVYGLNPSRFRWSEKEAEPVSRHVHRQTSIAPAPNIIVILADDLGYGDLGIQGNPTVKTPCIDALAAEGTRFTSFYASAAVCSPSRAGLLTGRYPVRCGIVSPIQAADDDFARKATHRIGVWMAQLGVVDMPGGMNMTKGLPPCEITIPEALQTAGYQTAAFGKWHLGDFTVLPEYHPHRHGFDHFVGFNMSNDDWPVAFWRDQEEMLEDIGLDQQRYTRLFTEEAVTFIEQDRDGPFFLYLAHKDPHQPFFPSDAFAGTSEGGPYGDAVAEFDWSVGEVAAAVRRAGIEDQTLIIVTSDNGPWFKGSPGGLRGRKGQSYEGGYRVPCVAWWPGRVPEGRIVDDPAMNIDFLPTFLGLAGLDPPEDRVIDGVDIRPLLFGGHLDSERALYFSHDYDIEAVRFGPWKYIRQNSHYVWPLPLDKKETIAGQLAGGRDYYPPGAAAPVPTLGDWPLLYHVGRDPGEAYNVLKKYPDVARDLESQLETWRATYLANPAGWL